MYFKLFSSCKQIKYKLLANDKRMTGDRNSSKSRVKDAKRLNVSLDLRQYMLGRTYKNKIVKNHIQFLIIKI